MQGVITAAPVIETQRLRLRGHRVEDFADCAAMWADPEVVRYIGGRPFSAEESWSKILRYAGLWPLLGYGYWAIEEKASGRFVGEAGFADFRREIVPSLDGMPEAGWVLAPWSHAKGFATEAMRAALAWGDRNLGVAETVCIILPEHTASIRVAGKCGYEQAGMATYKGHHTSLFRRPTPGGKES